LNSCLKNSKANGYFRATPFIFAKRVHLELIPMHFEDCKNSKNNRRRLKDLDKSKGKLPEKILLVRNLEDYSIMLKNVL